MRQHALVRALNHLLERAVPVPQEQAQRHALELLLPLSVPLPLHPGLRFLFQVERDPQGPARLPPDFTRKREDGRDGRAEVGRGQAGDVLGAGTVRGAAGGRAVQDVGVVRVGCVILVLVLVLGLGGVVGGVGE